MIGLKHINKHRSMWKVSEKIKYKSNYFNRNLKQRGGLGVNPLTILSRWGIKNFNS